MPYLHIREAVKSLVIIEAPPQLRASEIARQHKRDQKRKLRKEKADALQRRRDATMLRKFEAFRRRLERLAAKRKQTAQAKARLARAERDYARTQALAEARRVAVIHGLMALQRAGQLWVWIDEDQIRIARAPNYRKAHAITNQQAMNIVRRAKFLCSIDL